MLTFYDKFALSQSHARISVAHYSYSNLLLISKIISLVIFVCLAMWSIRNLKVHDVSCASATLHLVIITTVSKGLLYSTGGPAERSIIRSITSNNWTFSERSKKVPNWFPKRFVKTF